MVPSESVPAPAGANRRRWLIASVAAASAAAGGLLAWSRFRLGGESVADAALEGLWSREFQTPAGESLPMARLRGRPLLVNFWATWCPPCVEEMPLLDRFYRESAASGWQVLGLAIDQPSSVRQFLGRVPVSFPIGLAGLEGTELVKSLGNTAGGLPYTVVIGAEGSVRERKIGQVSAAELARWKASSGA